MGIANSSSGHTIEQLNNLLSGEMAAVDTYRVALEKLEPGNPAIVALTACWKSHLHRVTALQEKVRALGGSPTTTSGVWGAVSKAVEGGAAMLGDTLAIDALESGEDHGLACYRKELSTLDPDVRTLMTGELLPRQEQTHRMMSTLKRQQAARA